MPRSGAEARARLRDAALELYLDRGYDATTTAQIAERAEVTERTYFRHFADKREVLFDGEIELRNVMTSAIDYAPPGTRPLGLVIAAYRSAVPLFVAGRPVAQRRAEVIATTPALQERAHAKAAALSDALTAAVLARGIPEATARLASHIGAAIFEQAMRSWKDESSTDLENLITRAAENAQRIL